MMYDDASQKLFIGDSLNKMMRAKAQDAVQALGKGLPCTVVAIINPGIVTVNFEVAVTPAPLPQMTMPVGKPPYIQYPIQIGDIGVALSADFRTGGLTGLGAGVPNLQDTVGNLSTMTFFWLGSTKETFINSQATTLLEPTGNSYASVSASGTTLQGSEFVSGNVVVGSGATGTFTTAEGLTVTVQDGIVTNIY